MKKNADVNEDINNAGLVVIFDQGFLLAIFSCHKNLLALILQALTKFSFFVDAA